MPLVGSVEVDASKSNQSGKSTETKTGQTKQAASIDVVDTITSGRTDAMTSQVLNSGSVNTTTGTASNTGTQTTAGSVNTGGSQQQTSGSMNTTGTSGSENKTSTSGSQNTNVTSGSTNVIDTLGSINKSGTLGSTNTTSTDASVNTTSLNNLATTSGSANKNVTNYGTDASVNTSNTAARQDISTESSSTFNSGRTDTTQTILTQTATDRLIAQMLEGTQGLQAVTSGSRASGGYNSTARGMLTNDLIARTAGEVAVRGAMTVNTIGASSSSTNSERINNIAAINTTNVTGATKGQSITDAIIGANTTSTTGTQTQQVGATKGTQQIGATSGYQEVGGTSTTQKLGGTTATQNIGGIDTTQLIGGTSATQYVGGSTTANSYLNNIGGTSTSTSNVQSNLSTQNIGASNTGTSSQNTIGSTTSQQINNIGEKITDIFQNTALTQQQSTTNVGTKAKAGTILCTELLAQDKMNKRLHRESHVNFFNNYSNSDRAGYYIWAVPAVKHMRKHPNSFRSKLLKLIVTSAVKHIAGIKYDKELAPSLFDHSIYYTGRCICWVISKTVARKYNFNPSMLGE